MARETLFIIQPFDLARGKLKPGNPAPAKDAASAIAAAKRLSARHAGVVAFSRIGDAEIGEYDDPVILFRVGQIPPEME